MSEEPASPPQEERTPRFTLAESLVSGAVGVAGSWALVEILLTFNPFFLVFYRPLAIGVGAALIILPLLILLPEALRWLGGPDASGRFVRLCQRLEDWVLHIVGRRAPFSLLFAGLFVLSIGLFRAYDITEADIAKEELRTLGLPFSMASLQNALYFYDERAVCLFRRAGVRTEDIYRALGQPHDYTGDAPLLIGMFERIDQRAEEGNTERANELAVHLLNLLSGRLPDGRLCPTDDYQEVQARSFMGRVAGFLQRDGGGATKRVANLTIPFLLYTTDSEPRDDSERSLLSYALEHQAGTVAARLIQTETLPLPGTRLDLDLLGVEPFHTLETVDGYKSLLINPMLAVARGGSAGLDTADHRLLTLLCDKGVRPLPNTAAEFDSYFRQGEHPCPGERPPPKPETLPSLLTQEVLTSTIVSYGTGDGCSVVQDAVVFDADRPTAATQPEITSREGVLRRNQAVRVILQHMQAGAEGGKARQGGDLQDYIRAAWDDRSQGEGSLEVTGWNPASVPFPVRAPAFTLFLGSPTAGARRASDDADPEKWDTESVITRSLALPEDALTTGLALQMGERSGAEIHFGPPDVNVCVRVVRAGPAAEDGAMQGIREVMDSRLVNAVRTGLLRVPTVAEDDIILVEMTRAAPGAVNAQFTAAAADFLGCALEEKWSASTLGPSWQSDLSFEGRLAANETVVCTVEGEAAREVSIRLSGMRADLDLELLHAPPGTADLELAELVDSSSNLDAEEERIETVVAPGRYLIEVSSFAEEWSRFNLEVTTGPPLELPPDEGAGATQDDALALGELVPGSPLAVPSGLLQGQTADVFALNLPDALRYPVLLNVQLSDLSANLDLALLSDAGDEIRSSTAAGLESERLGVPIVAGGRYYVQVSQNTSAGVGRYRLTAHADKIGFLGTLARGRPLTETGSLHVEQPEAVYSFEVDPGSKTLMPFQAPEDVLFPVQAPGETVIALDQLENDADLFLLASDGQELESSRNAGADREAIQTTLEPGRYLVLVEAFDEASTGYCLVIRHAGDEPVGC